MLTSFLSLVIWVTALINCDSSCASLPTGNNFQGIIAFILYTKYTRASKLLSGLFSVANLFPLHQTVSKRECKSSRRPNLEQNLWAKIWRRCCCSMDLNGPEAEVPDFNQNNIFLSNLQKSAISVARTFIYFYWCCCLSMLLEKIPLCETCALRMTEKFKGGRPIKRTHTTSNMSANSLAPSGRPETLMAWG